MEKKKYCIKCLLEDMDEEGILKEVRELINCIPKEELTDELEYNRRLLICKECGNLLNGTCRKCGCYVELRAAGKKRYCPDVVDKWR